MALVVEDGTGKTDSDSYISIVDADTYNAAHEADTVYDVLDDTDKEKYLRLAAQDIGVMFYTRWRGSRSNETQAMPWPRAGVIDYDGYLIEDDDMPLVLGYAQTELAIKYANGTGRITATPSDAGVVKRKKVKAGPVESETEYVGGVSSSVVVYIVNDMLRGLIISGVQIERS